MKVLRIVKLSVGARLTLTPILTNKLFPVIKNSLFGTSYPEPVSGRLPNSTNVLPDRKKYVAGK